MMIVMKKSWFYDLGGFDPGMKLWGSEQFEMSIKARSHHLNNRLRQMHLKKEKKKLDADQS